MFLVVLRLHSVVFQWRQYIATPLWIEKHKNGFYTPTLSLNWNIMRNTEMRKPQAKASLQIASLMNPGHYVIVWKPERTSSSRGIHTNPRLMADLTRNRTTAGGRKKVSSGKNSQKDQDYASEPNVRLTWYKNLCSPQAHRSTTTNQTTTIISQTTTTTQVRAVGELDWAGWTESIFNVDIDNLFCWLDTDQWSSF